MNNRGEYIAIILLSGLLMYFAFGFKYGIHKLESDRDKSLKLIEFQDKALFTAIKIIYTENDSLEERNILRKQLIDVEKAWLELSNNE